MSYITIARDKKNKTVTQASAVLGCSRQYLSRLEQGKALATPEQARAIRDYLGVPVLEARHVSKFADLQREVGLRPFEVEQVNPDPWRAAYSCWGRSLSEAGLSLSKFDWMSHFLPGESSHECYALLQLALAGWQEFLGNPHEWGFDLNPITDRSGRLLAKRLLPGLIYRGEEEDCILWPQVTMRIDSRHAFRLDGLMLYRKSGKVYWPAVELDGGGHDARKDPYRSEKLGMLEVRISGAEIRQGKVFELLLERAAEAVRLQAEPAPKPAVRLLAPGRGTGWRPQAPLGPR